MSDEYQKLPEKKYPRSYTPRMRRYLESEGRSVEKGEEVEDTRRFFREKPPVFWTPGRSYRRRYKRSRRH